MKASVIKVKFNKHENLIRVLRFIYNGVKRPGYLQHKVRYGNVENDPTVYLIRPNTEDGIQGLMSLFIQTMRKIEYANRKGYIPYVDFQNYKTQYYISKHNVWNDYFSQPSDLSLDSIHTYKNVILSGVTLLKCEDLALFKSNIFRDEELAQKCHNLIKNYITCSREVAAIVNEEAEKLNIYECIGVYVRGTDYTKLKPPGEYVQPCVEQVIKAMKQFELKYPYASFFVVTEDGNIYNQISGEFGDKIRTVSFDAFILNYDGKDYLSKSNILNDDKVARGRDYLAKIVLLAHCKYLISSITMGSIAAYAMNGNKYLDKYIFDLGIYK